MRQKRLEKIINPLGHKRVEWVNARAFVPLDSSAKVCLAQGAGQESEGHMYLKIAHYDVRRKFWCDVDPLACIPEMRKPLEWEVIRYWVDGSFVVQMLGGYPG